MEDIKKEKRKIRKEIRTAAKKAGLTNEEYREQNSIDSKKIHDMALERLTPSEPKEESKEEVKPYDGVSNQPKYVALGFGKPKIRIARNAIYHYDHIVKLAENGHYLPTNKVYREESGEAQSFESKV